jgi:SAM-dependent methyltransferase
MAIQDSDKNIPRTVEKFDKKYLDEENPWGQRDTLGVYGDYNLKARIKIARVLDSLNGNVTEVGCGLGYALDLLSSGRIIRNWTGVDLSMVAVVKARKLFPHLKFIQSDITVNTVKDDIIILNEILWYVMHDMDKVLDNCQCKWLIINTGFLPEQKYGKEYIDGWNGLLRYLTNKNFTITHASYDSEGVPLKNGLVCGYKA